MLPAKTISVEGTVVGLTNVVQVIFPGKNTLYSYHSDIPDLKVGDYAIVASPYSQNDFNRTVDFYSQELKGHPTVVKVVSIEPSLKDVTKANKWLIQKVDIDAYVQRLAFEQRVEILKHRINEEKKKALELAELAKLRELNPTLGELVDQLAAMTGVTIEEKPIAVRAHKRAPTRRKTTTKASTSRAKKK